MRQLTTLSILALLISMLTFTYSRSDEDRGPTEIGLRVASPSEERLESVASSAQLLGTVTDIDGNVYRTVRIGDQWWMAENLRCTRYADGTPIVDGSNDEAGSHEPRFYRTQREHASPMAKSGNIIVYNWAAVMRRSSSTNKGSSGLQGPAPEGWHVPSQAEWAQLHDWLSIKSQGGPGKIIEPKLMGPGSSSGFNALYVDGWFRGDFLTGPADQANFWSSTRVEGDSVPHAYAPNLGARAGRFIVDNGANILAGWSVRCIKDKS